MKLTKTKLKQIIREELLKEAKGKSLMKKNKKLAKIDSFIQQIKNIARDYSQDWMDYGQNQKAGDGSMKSPIGLNDYKEIGQYIYDEFDDIMDYITNGSSLKDFK